MSGNGDRVEPGEDRMFIGPDRSPTLLHGQERNVHGAQDLLHLKYSEETHFRAQAGLYSIYMIDWLISWSNNTFSECMIVQRK